jgi:hypothetical protein
MKRSDKTGPGERKRKWDIFFVQSAPSDAGMMNNGFASGCP